MGSFSLWHWLIVFIYVAVIVVPIWHILKKAGYNAAFSLFALIPFVNIILLWVFAFSKWPIEKQNS